MNKEEPQGKIELHLGGCKQNNQTPKVPNELYTEWKDWASNRFNDGCVPDPKIPAFSIIL